MYGSGIDASGGVGATVTIGELDFGAEPDGSMIVSDGAGAPVFESGATLRTSIGLGTGDSPTFTGLTLTGVLSASNGSAAAPSYAFASDSAAGFYWTGGFAGVHVSVAGAWGCTLGTYDGGNRGLEINASGRLLWSSVTTPGGAADLALARLDAASLRQGLAPSATPIAQTFTLGEASRPGTDSNVGGGNGTERSGLGTGTGTPSQWIVQTPSVVASGSGVQTYVNRLVIDSAGAAISSADNGQASNVKHATDSQTLSGATYTFTNLIPAGSIVVGVTIRVTTLITASGGGASFSIGDGSDVDRWGTGIAFAANTTTTGADFTIATVPHYAAATSVVLTVDVGAFTGGVVRATVHYLSLTAATS